LIPKTIIRAKLGLKVPIYGSGRNVRDWIYVLDHCEGLMKTNDGGRVYDPEVYSRMLKFEAMGFNCWKIS
jgi:dTDP-D-glucose 4,6-dehydratase